MLTKKFVPLLLALLAALALAACGDSDSDARSTDGDSTEAAEVIKTVGPNGEKPAAASTLSLSEEELEEIQQGGYKAALVWAATSPFIEAVQSGAEERFEELGVEVVSSSQASFDAGKQASQLKTALARDPDVIISTPVDPTTAASFYDEALEAGVKLVFLSIIPEGYEAGKDYVGIVTDDLYDMGARAAHALAEDLGEEGKVGMITYDVPFYVTNQRDGAFKTTIEADYPEMEIAAEGGFADPSKVGDVASAMLAQNPELDGIYVSWSEPAQQVIAALRSANNDTTKLVTLDLDDTVVVDMVQGGQVVAVIADLAYELGEGLATVAGYGLVGKEAPPFSVVGAITVTADNVDQAYEESLHQPPSDAIVEARG